MVSRTTYEQLLKAEEYNINGDYGAAVLTLKKMLPGLDAKPYEKALVLRNLGYLYVTLLDFPTTIKYWLQSLAADGLPLVQQEDLRYSLAQVYLNSGAYQEGAETLEQWLQDAESPNPDAYVMLGGAYLELKRYHKADLNLRRAIVLRGRPKESWLQLLLSVRYEMRDYRGCLEVLQELVENFPGVKQYWQQLASIHMNLNDEKSAIAVLETAHRQGLLNIQRDLLLLANHYLAMKIPYKAAELLDRSIKSGRVINNRENWDLLATAWLQARETEKGIAALARAARLAKDGERDIRIARLRAEQERWEDVLAALRNGLAKGGMGTRGDAFILRGMAQYHLGHPDKAGEDFNLALSFHDTQELARQWLEYMDALQ